MSKWPEAVWIGSIGSKISGEHRLGTLVYKEKWSSNKDVKYVRADLTAPREPSVAQAATHSPEYQRAFDAMWEIACHKYGMECQTSGGSWYGITGDPVREMLDAAIHALNRDTDQ